MKFGANYKELGTVDVTLIKEHILTITEEQWEDNGYRQETFKPHKSTQTIPLIYDDDFRNKNPTTLPYYHELRELLEPITLHVSNFYDTSKTVMALDEKYPNGFFIRMILVRLLPRCKIPTHVDGNDSLSRSHRVHIPIITTDDTMFIVGGETKQMREGECWEINNQRKHAVNNDSDDIRVHLIMDYIIPGEYIDYSKCANYHAHKHLFNA